MQELVGAAVWCLIPYQGGAVSSNGSTSGWKIVFASPASHDLLGYRPEELEGRDWAEMIYPVDLPRLLHSITTTISPTTSPSRVSSSLTYQTSNSRSSSDATFEPPSVGLGRSGPSRPMSVYCRLLNKGGREVLFELRGHAYFGEDDIPETPSSSEDNGGFDGGGVMGVTASHKQKRRETLPPDIVGGGGGGGGGEEEKPCKAFWIMGRKWTNQGEGGSKMLDSFLELKLENERLRQELRDLQSKPYDARARDGGQSYLPQQGVTPTLTPSTAGSRIGSYVDQMYPRNSQAEVDYDDEDLSSGRQSPNASARSGGDEKKSKKVKNGKQPEYLCRNCGRNDSPEWRKGPLGAKTLCNACGLRWAKRNAGPPSKKPKDKPGKPEGGDNGDVRVMGQ